MAGVVMSPVPDDPTPEEVKAAVMQCHFVIPEWCKQWLGQDHAPGYLPRPDALWRFYTPTSYEGYGSYKTKEDAVWALLCANPDQVC